MKVSVVIPVFNEEKYIKACLDSLHNQIDLPDEIIVVDNNCTDKTVEIASRYPLVRIEKETAQGMIPARNKGFNTANYSIIARCDADSVLFPDWIQRIKYNFEHLACDAVTGPVFFYDLPLKETTGCQLFLDVITYLQKHETLIGPNMALTKKIWEAVKDDTCEDHKKVHEDMDLAIHIHRHNGVIQRDSSLVASISARRLKQKPHSFLLEYPFRVVRMLLAHRE